MFIKSLDQRFLSFVMPVLLAFSISLAAAPHAAAGDFQPKRVASDAQWLAFINVEGMVQSTLGKYMLEHGQEMGFDINVENMQDLEAKIGINPIKDVRGITIYGRGNPEAHKSFVAMFDTTAAIDDAVAQFTGQNAKSDDKAGGDGDDISTIDIGGQKVHLLSDGEQTTYFAVRPGPISDSRLVIVAMDREWMQKGLNVLDGKAGGLDHADKPLVNAAPAPGTLMFASTSDLSWIDVGDDDDDDTGPGSAIVKSAKGIDLAYGERGQDTFISARLETGGAEDAQNLSDIVRGLVAMARFAAGQEPELKPLQGLAKSLQLKTEGPSISMTFSHNTQQIIDVMKTALADGGHRNHDGKSEVKFKASVKVHGGDDDDDGHTDQHKDD